MHPNFQSFFREKRKRNIEIEWAEILFKINAGHVILHVETIKVVQRDTVHSADPKQVDLFNTPNVSQK